MVEKPANFAYNTRFCIYMCYVVYNVTPTVDPRPLHLAAVDRWSTPPSPSIGTPGAVATVGWSQRSRSLPASDLNLDRWSLVDPAVWSQPLIYINPTVAIFPLCALVYKSGKGTTFGHLYINPSLSGPPLRYFPNFLVSFGFLVGWSGVLKH